MMTTTTTTITPPTTTSLRIEFESPPPSPQYWLGLDAWVGKESGFQGVIIGAKLADGVWHYLIKDDALECWAPEEEVTPVKEEFPINYKGYRIAIAPQTDPTYQHFDTESYSFTLVNLATGEEIQSSSLGCGPIDTITMAKLAIDRRIESESQSVEVAR